MKTADKFYTRSTCGIMVPKSVVILFVFLLASCLAGSEFVFADPMIKIGSIEGGLSSTVYVSITFDDSIYEMGGFDFLIYYDATALTFMEATPGQLLEDCGWEYFTYRYEGTGLAGMTAVADINNGDIHPSCFGPPDTDPHELAELRFLITGDPGMEGMFAPIYFFWVDCNDNAVASLTGDTLFVSDHVYDFEGTDITDPTYGFPTYFGIQSGCFDVGPEDPTIIQYMDFMAGGILMYGNWLCGDPNGDWTINIFDITMIISYLYMDGPPPFPMISADVNNDGMVNIFDVTRLISYLYIQGPEPECP